MKDMLIHSIGRTSAVLVIACLLLPTVSAMGRPGQPKLPVAPIDGKPALLAPPLAKFSAATLSFRLRHDRRMDGSHIRVTAYKSRVGLYGTIPNNYQRRIAREIAQGMMGVTYVADHLRVETPPRPKSEILAHVRTALKQNPVTSGTSMGVQAYQDIVTLTGLVPTLRVKQAAIRIAKATPRVSVVQDHLEVSLGATGERLAESVREALRRDRSNPIRSQRVFVKGSYIYLRGAVYSRTAKRRAGDTAAAVPGVTGLSNSLTVLPQSTRLVRLWGR